MQLDLFWYPPVVILSATLVGLIIYMSETEAPFSAHSFCFMITILIHIKIHRKAYLAGMEAYSRHIYWGVLLLFAWIQSLIDTYL